MDAEIIRSRLLRYKPRSHQDVVNAMKEISQELALAALATAGFFKVAAFQGGTCLRIFHGLRRFSEDLDFILLRGDRAFQWHAYLSQLQVVFESFGLHLTVQDRSKAENAVKMAFIKEGSFGRILNIQSIASDAQKLRIKLEVDTSPPAGSHFDFRLLDFPYPASVTTQDLPSLFASKCHALLCRPLVKGRDWFDCIWYVGNRISINFQYLQHALDQFGPWQGTKTVIDLGWLLQALQTRVQEIDWRQAQADVRPFLKPPELDSLDLWDAQLFTTMTSQLETYLKPSANLSGGGKPA